MDDNSYPRAIINYLRRQPEAAVVKADIDAYERYLDDQDAANRKVQEAGF
jgi:hypothetical protein